MKLHMLRLKHPLTIRKKMLLSFFSLIFLPMFILVIVTYVNVTSSIEENTRYSAMLSFNQAIDMLSNKVNVMIKASNIIYTNADVRSILNRRESKTDIIQQNMDMRSLERLLNSLSDVENVYSVSLYTPSWMMFSRQDIMFHDFDRLKQTDLYLELLRCKDIVLWGLSENIPKRGGVGGDIEAISFLRRIYSYENYDEIIGIVKVSILKETIEDILTRANITKKGSVFIVNSNGDVVCSTDTVEIPNIANSKHLSNTDYNWQKIDVTSQSYLINSNAISNTDWKLVTAIPYDEFFTAGKHINSIIFTFAFFLGLIAFGIANLISSSITNRIILLRQNMQYVQQGNLDIKISTNGLDEIDQCIDSFNYMLRQIKNLLEEQRRNGQIIRRTELEVLQAQINPHFLYNILELINWKALDYDAREISQISQSLAKFYRSGLSNGEFTVPFRTEIECVQAYIEIQNVRFDNRIQFDTDIEADVYQYHILKMILQPLIENAIVHGILESGRKDGHIRLSANIKEDIMIKIEDNGAGMSKETITALLSDREITKQCGYGIKNIIERIKLCYGPSYGITYQSELGYGTCATIFVPKWNPEDFPQM